MKKRKVIPFISLLIFLLLISSTTLLAAPVKIMVLHTNDTHSRLEEGTYAGMGFAKIATIAEKYRAENDNLLLLDAGDTFHGQIIANLVKGESVARILNMIGYDALVPGNHDFNYGQERLKELDQLTDLPLLAANIKTDSDNNFLTPYIIKKLKDVKVGIFGLVTPETVYKTHPKNVEGLKINDPVATARFMANKLKDRVDLIIALTHLGLSQGSRYTSIKVAEEVEGIDLIIDGHSHDALSTGKIISNTLIAMAGEYDKNLGVVELTIDKGKIIEKEASLINKKDVSNIKKDEKVLKLIDKIKKKNREITAEVIGKTAVTLDGERANIRTEETNLGNLITDSIQTAVAADAVLLNSGTVRASIEAGDITKGDVISVLPFGNTVVVKALTGSQLLDALEHGVSQYPAQEGTFPQVAGLTFIFNPYRQSGERILRLMVNGEVIDYDRLYYIATNDFIAAGGDGYNMFIDAPVVQEVGSLEELLINYIKKQEVVSPEVEGRIIPSENTGRYFKYEVKPGEVLSEIAEYFEVSLAKIVSANNIKNINLIYAGRKLLIPAE